MSRIIAIARNVQLPFGLPRNLLFQIAAHEFAHAWPAYELGDPTARYLGRISLNPLVHLDPVSTMMMVMSAIAGRGMGWGKPVPFNPYNLRNQKWGPED